MMRFLTPTAIFLLLLTLSLTFAAEGVQIGLPLQTDYLVLNLEEDITTTTVAQSGSMVVFDFTVTCMLEQDTADVWFDLLLPDGQEIGPYYMWWDVPMVPGETYYKHCLLYISPMCMPGVYTVLGRCGDHFPLVILDDDSFTFEKLTGTLGGGTLPGDQTPTNSLANTRASNTFIATDGGDPSLELLSLSPQPCNPEVEVAFLMHQSGDIRMTLYDIQGRRILEKKLLAMNAGHHQITLPTSEVSSGMYIISLEANGTAIQERLTILK